MKPASIRPPHATTSGGNGMVFTSALNLTFSPGEKEQPQSGSVFADERSANSDAGFLGDGVKFTLSWRRGPG
jgi:hypothetical protein